MMKITVLLVHHFYFLSVSHVTLALLQCHIDQTTVLCCAQHKTLKPAFHQRSATWNFHQCCFASDWTKRSRACLQFESLFLWLSPITETDLIHSETDLHPVTLSVSPAVFFQNAFYGLFTSWIHGLNSKGLEDLVCQIRKTKNKIARLEEKTGEAWNLSASLSCISFASRPLMLRCIFQDSVTRHQSLEGKRVTSQWTEWYFHASFADR